MGGYPGLFALMPYREKLSEYRSLENRDLWEYQLDLTPEETGRMVEHVWELKQIQFDYFFFDENCSYRLLELLQVARPSLDLTSQFPLTAIPTDTVKAVKQSGWSPASITAPPASVNCWPAPNHWITTKSSRCWPSVPIPQN